MTYHDAKTDVDGWFVLGDFPKGISVGEILVEHPGYSKLLVQIELSGNMEKDFQLEDRSLLVDLLDPTGEPITEDLDVEFTVSPDSRLLFRDPLRITMSPVEGQLEFHDGRVAALLSTKSPRRRAAAEPGGQGSLL